MSSISHQKIAFSHLSSRQLANLCGKLHENVKLMEHFFNIHIKIGHNEAILSGRSDRLFAKATKVIKKLHQLSNNPIDSEQVNVLLVDHQDEDSSSMIEPIQLSRKLISPRNDKQAEYLESINRYDIVFAVGPAGTGKTYLAVAKALEYFERGEIQRLVLVRPAVEAGEKLGFLPGDLVEKVLPYLRPIYDALYEMIGFKEAQKLIKSDVIEVLPLAFMRGRTLNEAFIILDEAQNTTILQMKMFLTRMGFGSKTVVTGDLTQVDLPNGTPSGLGHAVQLFADIDKISIQQFTSREVVRHPLVSRIIDCYDANKKG